MEFLVSDYNGADAYFDGQGAAEWSDLEAIVRGMPLYFHPSDQRGIQGRPIFDPKGTNAHLTREAEKRGWKKIPVPKGLTEFGVDWDAGKGSTLAEWQFSNYPFLWNNVIRTEGVVETKLPLPGMKDVCALVVVTKCGVFPASNSTLYYEQGHAQLEAATGFGTFSVPIRLVGLTIPKGTTRLKLMWSVYPGRYSRDADSTTLRDVAVTWKTPGKYNAARASFELV